MAETTLGSWLGSWVARHVPATHDEAYATAAAHLTHLADAAARSFNAAGLLLAECQRQGVPPPGVYGPDADGDIRLRWGPSLVLYVGRNGVLCGGHPLADVRQAPNAGAAVRWLKERLGGGG